MGSTGPCEKPFGQWSIHEDQFVAGAQSPSLQLPEQHQSLLVQ